MFRLILKDILLVVKILPWVAVWMGFNFFMVLTAERSPAVLTMTPVLVAFVLVAFAVAADDKHKTERLYCSLPLKRDTIVLSKYVSTGAILLLGILAGLCIGFFVPNPILTLERAFYVFFFSGMFFLVLFPINFKLGFSLESNAKAFALIMAVIGTIIAGLVYLLVHFEINLFEIPNIAVYLGLGLVVSTVLSIKLSVRFFRRRDF